MSNDTFRLMPRDLSDEQKKQIDIIKVFANDMLMRYQAAAEEVGCDPRLMSLAKTALEESVMWAVKAIT